MSRGSLRLVVTGDSHNDIEAKVQKALDVFFGGQPPRLSVSFDVDGMTAQSADGSAYVLGFEATVKVRW